MLSAGEAMETLHWLIILLEISTNTQSCLYWLDFDQVTFNMVIQTNFFIYCHWLGIPGVWWVVVWTRTWRLVYLSREVYTLSRWYIPQGTFACTY